MKKNMRMRCEPRAGRPQAAVEEMDLEPLPEVQHVALDKRDVVQVEHDPEPETREVVQEGVDT